MLSTDEDLLFHYTTLENLLNILKGEHDLGGQRHHVLWASDLRYCNDASETLYGREAVMDLVNDARGIKRTSVVPDSTPAVLPDDVIEHLFDEGSAFGVCFTKEGDSLTHWRAYAPNGCAVGFARSAVDAMHTTTGVFFGQTMEMVYGPEGIKVAAERVLALEPPTEEQMNYTWVGPIHAGRETAAMAMLKHESFAAEHEVRRVFTNSGGGTIEPNLYPSLFHRVNADGLLVPYVKVYFALSGIRTIYVGPGVHRDDNVHALRQMIKALCHKYDEQPFYDVMNVVVKASDSPYR